MSDDFEGERGSLRERLERRRDEIEQAILARAYSISDPTGAGDHEYVSGLRGAVDAAVTYGLAAVDLGKGDPPVVPGELLAQARLAARNGVSLDTVLRRYFAGYTLLGDFVVGEAKRSGPAGDEESHRYARAQARLFDRLIVAIAQEYAQEERGRSRGVEHARAERVKRLLAGELVEEAELGYELGAWHLAVVATGPGSLQAFRDVAAKLDRRLLLVRPGKGAVWAWLGGARKVTAGEFAGFTSSSWPEETSLAIGEPAYGVTGWRLTHRQAVAALPILERGSERMVCYSDVALLASALRDEVLSNSLVQTYLAPLAKERDGGVNLRHTLRAYFDAAGNVSSAAAALDVSRQTVNSRLRTIEKRIGRPLRSCAAEVELALRLRSLSRG